MKKQQLHTVAKIIAGQSPPSSTYNSKGDGLPFFQGKTDFQEKYPRVRLWCNSLKAKEAKPGDILMSVRAPVGSVNICDQKSIIGRGLAAIRASSILDPDFLYFFLKSNEQTIAKLGTGSTFKATKGAFELIKMIKPPIDLQNQFAIVVGKIEGIKTHYQQSLTNLEVLYGALSQQAFKGELNLSHVPLPDIRLEKEKTVDPESLPTRTKESLVIHLPDTDNLLNAIENVDSRNALIIQWLEAYHSQLGGMPFSVPRFMAAAQTRLAELHPETDFELGVNDYEYVKTWVFETLTVGRLQQSRNITGRDESGEPIFGNLIEIKRGARP